MQPFITVHVSSEMLRTDVKLTCFIKEERILILLQVLRGPGLIQEQRIRTFDVLHLNLCPLKKTKHMDHQHWSTY